MSNTRKAESGKPFRQERYASSIEYERGLMASLVARRCSVIPRAADRQLVYFLQLLSNQGEGLKAVVASLRERFASDIATKTMLALGCKPERNYHREQCAEIREEILSEAKCNFPLRGEYGLPHYDSNGQTEKGRRIIASEILSSMSSDKLERAAQNYPANYSASQFLAVCQAAFESELESDLKKLCLDPAIGFSGATKFAPWYFPNALANLRQYQAEWIAARNRAVVVTEIGHKVGDTLDFTAQSKCMTVVDGLARIGKSFAARSWCEQHPGAARYVEVPTGNDDVGFFRAIARGLGLGNFAQYKAVEIRERVESVLLTGDLILCLDEAHRLWPEVNLRYGFPKRINWVMSMANHSVPICLVGTPQFIERQKASEQSGWNSAQFLGRIGHYEKLPDSLAERDLTMVAESLLPEGDERSIETLVRYAQASAKYLAGMECAVRRARYLAGKAERNQVSFADIKLAVTGSVIPSDRALALALAEPVKGKRKLGLSPVQMPVNAPVIRTQSREVSPRSGAAAGAGEFAGSRQTRPLQERERELTAA